MTLSLDAAVGILTADPATTVLCSDFDGTLAPIVPDPEDARPAAGSLDALVQLSHRLQRVAVVSGRPLEFLERRLGPDLRASAHLFGRYGAEHALPGGSIELYQQAKDLRWRLEAALERVAAVLPEARLEDKGGSVVLHWREQPELEAPLRALAAQLARELDLEVRPGKMVLDLGEIGAPDKGQALASLLVGSACGAYLGDDLGDLDAFGALDELVAEGGMALRVAVGSAEAPGELLERADLVLDTPEEASAFLQQLVSSLR